MNDQLCLSLSPSLPPFSVFQMFMYKFTANIFTSPQDGRLPGPSFSKHLKSVTMVTCLSPKCIHLN